MSECGRGTLQAHGILGHGTTRAMTSRRPPPRSTYELVPSPVTFSASDQQLCLAARRPAIRRLSISSRLTAVAGRYAYPIHTGG